METTPIAVRSRVELPDGFEDRIRDALATKLGHAATLIERVTVRFEDINGPKGGVDTICRIKLVLSSRPSVQVEERGVDPAGTFARALPVLVTALARMRGKHGVRTGRTHREHAPAREARMIEDAGEVIGRRVGRGRAALAHALDRPEKERRDAYVDTALPDVSESDRRAGHDMSARRNTQANPRHATTTLEDSRTKPSRKSTRRSANRGKPSHGKERSALARSMTPAARAARSSSHRR